MTGGTQVLQLSSSRQATEHLQPGAKGSPVGSALGEWSGYNYYCTQAKRTDLLHLQFTNASAGINKFLPPAGGALVGRQPRCCHATKAISNLRATLGASPIGALPPSSRSMPGQVVLTKREEVGQKPFPKGAGVESQLRFPSGPARAGKAGEPKAARGGALRVAALLARSLLAAAAGSRGRR